MATAPGVPEPGELFPAGPGDAWVRALGRVRGVRISRVRRIGLVTKGGDLLGAPLRIELCLHLGPQLGIYGELWSTRTPSSFPAAVVSQVPVMNAVVVRAAVAPELPADRRRRTPEPTSYLADRQAAVAQRRCPPAFQQ